MVRPRYLEEYGVPPPSQTQQSRSTVEYRCYRLIGLSNLYYWAISWCVHAANDWKLGEPASSFDLRQKELSSLGLETLMDVAKCGFVYKDFRILARQRNQDMREGWFVCSNISWGQSLRYFNVTAETGDDADSEPPEFIDDDRVLAIKPPQHPECVPMALICTRLRGAYTNAAANLREAGISWTGPPFFKGFESWEDLAKDMEVRGTDPRVVLQDLEKQRKKVVTNVEHVLMVNTQDGNDGDDEAVDSIVLHSDACISVPGGEPFALSDNQGAVLESFIANPAMDTETLKMNSGCDRAPQILRDLAKMNDGVLANYITLPGGKGKGGYSVRIRRAK